MLAGVEAAGGGSGVLALASAHEDVLGQFTASGTGGRGPRAVVPVSSKQVESALCNLSARIGESAKRGPHGPHLGGYHFTSDWDAWGIGNPKPIADLPLSRVDLSSLEEVALEDFIFEP